jgi:PAS domain S-box-containing protein
MASLLGLEPQALLQSVLDDVGVALAIIDNQRRFVFTNQAARDLFGAADNLSVEEWRRRNYKVHDSEGREIPPGQAPIGRALAGEEVEPHEVRVTRPDGTVKWLHVAAHPFSVLGLTGVLVVIADETEQIELRKAIERFQRVEQFAVLAGGLAHDFNNILSVVSENAALALNEEDLGEIRGRLQQMRVALNKGSALVARLMQYSRMKGAETRSVQINDVVHAAVELTHPLIAGRVRVKTEISPHLPEVEADASRLEQVLVNLILNSFDAMPEGGELTLGTKLVSCDALPSGERDGKKQFVLVTVADTGIGIPEDVRANIFDAFFTTKSDEKRAGLGLAGARAILSEYKGHISVESETGSGTKFSIYLPA